MFIITQSKQDVVDTDIIVRIENRILEKEIMIHTIFGGVVKAATYSDYSKQNEVFLDLARFVASAETYSPSGFQNFMYEIPIGMSGNPSITEKLVSYGNPSITEKLVSYGNPSITEKLVSYGNPVVGE